jgi:hypothetical protein
MANCSGDPNLNAVNEVLLKGESDLGVQADVITYPTKLLRLARKLMDDDESGIAIVICHVACEVAVQRCFPADFDNKRRGWSLRRDELRRQFNALRRSAVENQPFWTAFADSCDWRNDIVHRQRLASKDEAEASHVACSSLITYLGQ